MSSIFGPFNFVSANQDNILIYDVVEFFDYRTNLIVYAFKSPIAKKYPNAKKNQSDCYNLIKEYMQYRNMTNSIYNTYRDSKIKYYCHPKFISTIFESDNSSNNIKSNTNSKAQVKKEATEVDFTKYMSEIQRKIRANWIPPIYNSNSSKKIVVIFKISKDGSLLSYKVTNSSGIQDLDNSAINAIKKSAPFNPLPKEYEEDYVDINFSFDYNVLY